MHIPPNTESEQNRNLSVHARLLHDSHRTGLQNSFHNNRYAHGLRKDIYPPPEVFKESLLIVTNLYVSTFNDIGTDTGISKISH